MPSKNVLKVDLADTYYHVYARGASKQTIFLDNDDFSFFLNLFRRYLSEQEILNGSGIPYEKLHEHLEILAYCLMGNHFHLLVYQHQVGGMQRLMRGVMTAYSRYFNTKYGRSGQLFESRYKASRISSQEYLEHISRYIHLNPKDWRFYPYSSLPIVLGRTPSDWVRPGKIVELFESPEAYEAFVADYEASQRALEEIKHELANNDY